MEIICVNDGVTPESTKNGNSNAYETNVPPIQDIDHEFRLFSDDDEGMLLNYDTDYCL